MVGSQYAGTMLGILLTLALSQQAPRLESNGLSGYINMTAQLPPKQYGYGVSLYSAAWPLIEGPIADFQIGLASTWILPDNASVKTPLLPHGTVARDSMPERGPSFWTVFQTIEGGLGYWASNRYIAPTAKFRMNGTTDGYNHEISTPGWEFGGQPLPGPLMGIAQVSAHLLVPPDGLTLAKNTRGELFGYAYMALPLIPARGEPVATGNQCWTAFLNTKNFRGPVAFYLPSAWSRISRNYPPAVGRGLDTLRGISESGAIEINSVPQFVSHGARQISYTRIPRLQFPADGRGQTILMHNLTVYSKKALWDQVAGWMEGGSNARTEFDAKGAFLPTVKANPLEIRQGAKAPVNGLGTWISTATLDAHTFGLQWNPQSLAPWKNGLSKGIFPEYFKHVGSKVQAITEAEVPIATGLRSSTFPAPNLTRSYLPSEKGKGVWMHPGPKAGPFKAILVDGSVVTYYWYRFVDQPSLQSTGLSKAEKAKLQAIIEKIHRYWTKEKLYMAPPGRGALASLDSAEIVNPPKGLEIGYVPVAIRQDPVR